MMPKTSRVLLLLLVTGLMAFNGSVAFGAEKENGEKKVVGSIRPAKKLKDTELPALAKISFEQALKAALVAAPGSVIKAELEIEDGNLMYSFEIVGADKKKVEVEVDAGNGAILDVDKG